MKIEFSKYVPVGISHREEVQWIGTALLLAFFYSLKFFIAYGQGYNALFYRQNSQKIFFQDAYMPDFVVLLGHSLTGFAIIALTMLGLIAYHYAFHYQGSKSIYLMKRLPSRRELWRRCLSIPLTTMLLCLLLSILLLLIYYAFYMLITPAQCLPPAQWQTLWQVWMGGI